MVVVVGVDSLAVETQVRFTVGAPEPFTSDARHATITHGEMVLEVL